MTCAGILGLACGQGTVLAKARAKDENAKTAMAAAHEESPQLAVVDLKMPGRSGLELVRDLSKVFERWLELHE